MFESSYGEEEQEEGYFFEDGFESREKPEVIINEKENITWADICEVGNRLKGEFFYSGPFSKQQFEDKLNEVLLEKDLKHLISLGLIEKVGEDTYRATEKGRKVAEANNSVLRKDGDC